MPFSTIQQATIDAGSYSRLQTYEACAFKAKLAYVDKIKEPENDAMRRGTAIHKQLEDFAKGATTELPDVNFDFSRLLEFKNPIPELEFTFDKDWNPTDWFAPDAWYRAKIDLVFGNLIIDYKTGKQYKVKHLDQKLQYAAAFTTVYPQDLLVEFWYLDHDQIDRTPVTLHEAQQYRNKLTKRLDRMTSDTEFRPNPNAWNCKYCYYKKTRDCPYAYAP